MYYFIKFNFINKYIMLMRGVNILFCVFWLKEKLLFIEKKSILKERRIDDINVTEYWYAFFSELKSDHTLGVSIII